MKELTFLSLRTSSKWPKLAWRFASETFSTALELLAFSFAFTLAFAFATLFEEKGMA